MDRSDHIKRLVLALKLSLWKMAVAKAMSKMWNRPHKKHQTGGVVKGPIELDWSNYEKSGEVQIKHSEYRDHFLGKPFERSDKGIVINVPCDKISEDALRALYLENVRRI